MVERGTEGRERRRKDTEGRKRREGKEESGNMFKGGKGGEEERKREGKEEGREAEGRKRGRDGRKMCLHFFFLFFNNLFNST